MAAGRLRSSFTRIDRARSLTDPDSGAIVQPFNDFSRKDPVPAGQARDYQVEFWPIGNRFERGHRLRLSLVGAPVLVPARRPGAELDHRRRRGRGHAAGAHAARLGPLRRAGREAVPHRWRPPPPSAAWPAARRSARAASGASGWG